MAKDDYEILPQKLIEDLKYDVEALKKKLNEPDAKSNELILEIETLKDSVHELNNIFQKALEETKEEDVFKSIKVLNERIDAVVTQNETIAKGMIAISDKLDEFMNKGQGSMSPRSQMGPNPSIGPAPSNFPGPSAPRMAPPEIAQNAPSIDDDGGVPLPPGPPSSEIKKKKRSFF
ncbi:hypothetical protein HN385_03325 [archaeon]|jgi:hypothetical protein|nr:hypothetical protein [archaeon]MBT6869727.1 hypothetical protein [archaeon]MBT7192682.1 hypothetical protein [archaeon]MBT7380707.1 hypothetical protein [archaeon]MBT7508357.1 hypothetical protein [archaeon]